MWNNKMMVVNLVAIVSGLLVAAALADTPYPEEAAGSACYADDDANCQTGAHKFCQQGGHECVICSDNSEINRLFCAASSEEEECTTSGTQVDCGESHEGECLRSIDPPFEKCKDTSKVISTTGCGAIDVECTGTKQL